METLSPDAARWFSCKEVPLMICLPFSAEKVREDKNGRYNRREYNYSSWSRSFTLPEDTNAGKIAAEYKNGELYLHIPRTEGKEIKKVQQIAINEVEKN